MTSRRISLSCTATGYQEISQSYQALLLVETIVATYAGNTMLTVVTERKLQNSNRNR